MSHRHHPTECIQCGQRSALATPDCRWWCSWRHKVMFEAEMTLWQTQPFITGDPQRCVLCGAWAQATVCAHHGVDAVRLAQVTL
jgi:hypothetical protein